MWFYFNNQMNVTGLTKFGIEYINVTNCVKIKLQNMKRW